MATNAHVVNGCGAHFVGILVGLHAQFGGEFGDLVAQFSQGVYKLLHGLVHAFFFNKVGDDLAQLFELGAVVTQDLSPEQIKRLNSVVPS